MLNILKERSAMKLGFIVSTQTVEERIRNLFPEPDQRSRLFFLKIDSIELTDNAQKYIELLNMTCDHVFICLNPGMLPDAIAGVFQQWFPRIERMEFDKAMHLYNDDELMTAIKTAYNFSINMWIRADITRPCAVCKTPTTIIDTCWHTHICSERCVVEYEKVYGKALRGPRSHKE